MSPFLCKGNGIKTKKQVCALIVSVFVAILGLWLPGKISVSTSASLNERVFWRLNFKEGSPLRVGDVVQFTGIYPTPLGFEQALLSKHVMCTEGSWLSRDWAGNFFCDGQFIAAAPLSKTSTGMLLPVFDYAGLVPTGKILVIGDSDRSYDGRYFGFIEEAKIEAVLFEIF